MSVGVAAAVEVRLEQCGRAVLRHAVLHHLHGGRAEPALGQGLAPPDQVRDLLHALGAVPPQRADHVRAELAAGRSVDVRRAGVVHAGVRADDRVLPARDAERVQVGLAGKQSGAVVGAGGAGQVPGDQGGRALVEGAARVAVRVPLDAAVGRVRRVPGDARELQRPGVDPGAVVVAVGQEHRPVRHHGVEVGGERRAARERRHRPAAAEDPLDVGAAVGVRADRGEVLLAGVELRQVAPEPLQPALDRVHVRVGEARGEQAAARGRRRVRRDRAGPARRPGPAPR